MCIFQYTAKTKALCEKWEKSDAESGGGGLYGVYIQLICRWVAITVVSKSSAD